MKHCLKKLALLFCCISSLHSMQAVQEEKAWTLLVYLAAGNNLAEFSYSDIQEMMKVGSNEYINVLVYWTVLNDDGTTETKKLYIKKGEVEQLGETMYKDSGDKQTLKEALEWALTDFPSRRVAVDFWDHGSGPLNPKRTMRPLRGICFDDYTHNYLNDWDCQEALLWAMKEFRGGKKFDIVTCDACLMGSIELAQTFEPCAKYYVASQDLIPGDGYDYARALQEFEDGYVTTYNFASNLAEAYEDTYENQDDYTLSVIDLREITALTENLNKVALFLIEELKGSQKRYVKRVITKSMSSRYCLELDAVGYRDLYAFYRNLLTYARDMNFSSSKRYRFERLLRDGLMYMNIAILKNVYSSSRQGAHGLSIYLPGRYDHIDASYYDLYWAKQSYWVDFLRTFVKSAIIDLPVVGTLLEQQ